MERKTEEEGERGKRILKPLNFIHPCSDIGSMYIDYAPPDFGVPDWFWGHLRPCDRFLLLKRILVVDLTSVDSEIINAIDRPDFSNARKTVKKLKQLHVIVSPVYIGAVRQNLAFIVFIVHPWYPLSLLLPILRAMHAVFFARYHFDGSFILCFWLRQPAGPGSN